MVCNLPRVQVERFIKYAFVKINNEGFNDFMSLASDIYKETSADNNKNALTYLQMLPSVFITLYTQRAEVRSKVAADQLAVAGPKIDAWSDIGNIVLDLGIVDDKTSTGDKLFVDTGKDLTINGFNRPYQNSAYVVEGLQADAANNSKDYNKEVRIRVVKHPSTKLKSQFVPVRDMNGVPVAGLQTAVQHSDFYVVFEYKGKNDSSWGIMGYIKPLQYYDNGKPIDIDDVAKLVNIPDEILQELKDNKPAYDALFNRLSSALGDQNAVTLTLEKAGIELHPNYNKFSILEEHGDKKNYQAEPLAGASDHYQNNGKGIIIKAYNGQYVTEATDDEAPALPQYKDAMGNPTPFRGYFALTTMPNGRKFWVGVRPTKLITLGEEAKQAFANDIAEATQQINSIRGNNPDNAAHAEEIANTLNNKYYFYTGNDYNIFFISNYNAETGQFQIRADFLLSNAPIGVRVPALYVSSPNIYKNYDSVIQALNRRAKQLNIPVNLDAGSVRSNIPFDRSAGVYEKQSQAQASRNFSTTVAPSIFERSFFTIKPVQPVESAIKTEVAKPAEVKKELSPEEASTGLTKEQLQEIQKQAEEKYKKLVDKKDSSPFKLAGSTKEDPITEEERAALKAMLPSFIAVEELDSILDTLNNKGIALGYFKDKIVYLSKLAGVDTAFHEAFHAIFRTVLSDSEINALLSAGSQAVEKANPTAFNEAAVKEFKQNRSYDVTDEEAKDLIVEEYLADKFAEYAKNKRRNSFIKNLFDKVARFAKWLLGKNTDLEKFFDKASNNKFYNSTIKNNRFTNIGYGTYSLIPGTTTLAESEGIVKTIAGRFVEDSADVDNNIDIVLDDMAYFYSLTNPENVAAIHAGTLDPQKLADRMVMYTNPTSRAIIKSEVNKLLNISGYDIDLEDFQDLESEYGRAADNVLDKSIDESGGFDGVSKEIKRFILFTTYQTIDDITGRPVRKAIDGEYVYANLERSLAGKSPSDILSGLKALSLVNPQIKAVYDKLKQKTGLVESTQDTVGNEASFSDLTPDNYADNLEGKQAMIRFFKALEKNFLNHLQVVVSYSDGNNTNKVFSSNRQDAPNIQLGRWQANYLSNVHDTLKNDAAKRTRLAKSLSDFIQKYNSGTVTLDDITSLHGTLSSLALEFEPAYLRMSFSSKDDSVASVLRKAFPDATRLSTSFLDKLSSYLHKNSNIFESGDLTSRINSEGEVVDASLVNIILSFVRSNVLFDTNIFQTNFKTADNKTRYSYVYPNYYVSKIQELNRKLSTPQAIADLKNNTYYKYNHLINLFDNDSVNNQVVATNFKQLYAEITGDIREETIDDIGRKDLKDGTVFKDTDPKALILTTLALYNSRHTRSTQVKEEGKPAKTVTTAYARFWPLQLEAKSTMLSVDLPIIDGLYENGKLTNAARKYLRNYLSQEIARIGILTKPYSERNSDYKIDNKRNEFVYFKFLNNPTVDSILEIERNKKGQVTARKEKVTAEDINKIMSILEDGLLKEKAAFLETLAKHNIYTRSTNLLDTNAVNKYGTEDNYLGSFFFNSLLNSIGIKQLMFGDESQFKDDTDLVKRASGLLAFGVSRGERVYKTAYTTEATVQLNRESLFDGSPNTSIGGDDTVEINTDDGGSEMTTQEFIDIQYDLGRLDSDKLEALNYLKDGIKPGSPEEARYEELVDKLAKKAGVDSTLGIDGVSMKLVSFGGGFIDGNYVDNHNIYYDKMSVAVLFKNFTSRWDENSQRWVAQKGLEALHNKRVWMEKNGIGQVNPKSAGKLKTGPLMDHTLFNSVSLDENADLPENLHYTPQQRAGKNQRLQVEVASHGVDRITAMSQALQLIDTGSKDAKLKAEFQSTLAELRNRAFSEALNIVSREIVQENSTSRDIKFFLEKVRDTITNTTPSYNLLEFLATEGTDTKYDFNVPAVVSKLENVFLAHFNKDTLVQKMPGRTLVLRTSRDYNVIIDKDGNVVTRDTYLASPDKYSDNETRELRVHKLVDGKIQHAEIVVSRGTAMLYGLRIGYNIPESLLEGFGVRIPTEGYRSMIPFKIVDFLPDYMGDSVIIPKEILLFSGADFDIDKMYAYVKSFYRSNRGVSIYGSAVTPKARYEEYIQWEIENNPNVGLYKKHLIENNQEMQELTSRRKQLLRINKLGPLAHALDSFEAALTARLFTGDSSKELLKEVFDSIESTIGYETRNASGKKELYKSVREELKDISDRISQIQYNTYKEIYDRLGFYTQQDFKYNASLQSRGALMNKLIYIHSKFVTNPEIAKELATPTTTKYLEQDANLIASLSGKSEGRFIGSSINGILDSWINNVQGKRLVGAWANVNIVNASLTKHNVTIKGTHFIKFDGTTYGSFGRSLEDDVVFNEDGTFSVVKEVRSKADTVSSNVSAATDNAKERLMARLNYTDDTVGVYGAMMSLGIGRTRVNLFAAQPILKKYTDMLVGAKTNVQRVGSTSGALSSLIKESKSKLTSALSVTVGAKEAAKLVKAYSNQSIKSEELVKAIKDDLEGAAKYANDLRVLLTFQKMQDLADASRNYARLLSINRGILSTFDYVDSIKDAADELGLGDLVGLSSTQASGPFDVREFIVPSDKPGYKDSNIYNNLLNIRRLDDISRKFFIKNTSMFKKVQRRLVDTTVRTARSSDKDYMEKALYNFVVMQAYGKWLKENRDIDVSSYSPLVYNSLKEATLRDKFQSLLEIPEFRANELVRFITTRSKGIQDIVSVNTRLKSTPATEERFTNAYDALLNSSNASIRNFAAGLFGYMLARDGASFGSGSIVKFINPSMFYNMAKTLKSVNVALYKEDNNLMKEVTGSTIEELRSKFYQVYISDAVNYPLLPSLPVDTSEDGSKETIKPRITANDRGTEVTVYTLSKKDGGFDITSRPIHRAYDLFGSNFMHTTTDDKGDTIIDPPRAFRYSFNGKRHVYALSKIDRQGTDKGIVYTFSYREIPVVGQIGYNPYTVPLEYSREHFSTDAKITKTSTPNTLPSEENNVPYNVEPDPVEEQFTAEQEVVENQNPLEAFVKQGNDNVQPPVSQPKASTVIDAAVLKYTGEWLAKNPRFILADPGDEGFDDDKAVKAALKVAPRVTLENLAEAREAQKDELVSDSKGTIYGVPDFATEYINFDINPGLASEFEGFANIQAEYTRAINSSDEFDQEFAAALVEFAKKYGILLTSELQQANNPNQISLWDTEGNDSETPFDC